MTNQIAIRFQNLVVKPGPAHLGPVRRPGGLSEAELTRELKTILAGEQWSPQTRDLVRALVLLWHDHLDAAHTLSQSIEHRDGSLVHAIMHRREPDYGNSKYWWRRVGEHPCFVELGKCVAQHLVSRKATALAAQLAAQGKWNALEFVDLCEAAAGARDDLKRIQLLEEIQQVETQVALQYLLRNQFNLEFALP